MTNTDTQRGTAFQHWEQSFWLSNKRYPIGHEIWSADLASAAPAQPKAETLQYRVHPWLMACFGQEIASDTKERNHRFLEEALELVQACGCTVSEAHQLVDYVYGRPVGSKAQEAGGVMITLAALCLAQDLDMHEAGEVELSRIWTMVEKIRAKQAAKPKHSPLPEAPKAQPAGAGLPRPTFVEMYRATPHAGWNVTARYTAVKSAEALRDALLAAQARKDKA